MTSAATSVLRSCSTPPRTSPRGAFSDCREQPCEADRAVYIFIGIVGEKYRSVTVIDALENDDALANINRVCNAGHCVASDNQKSHCRLASHHFLSTCLVSPRRGGVERLTILIDADAENVNRGRASGCRTDG